MKIVVIGSNSFSGQDFIDLALDNSINIVGVSRSDEKPDYLCKYKENNNIKLFKFVKCDINKNFEDLKKIISKENPEYVINFASQSEVAMSWEFPWQWYQTNTVGLSRLIKELTNINIKKYIHISTCEVYGTCRSEVNESTPVNPTTPYAASKASGETIVKMYSQEFGLPINIIRSTNVYGAYQQLFKIIPKSIIYPKLNRRISVHGGGIAKKSYIHIRDVSHCTLDILLKGTTGEIYNISPVNSISILELIEKIFKQTGKDMTSYVEFTKERKGQDKDYRLDSSKARKQFNWNSKICLENGIDDVIKWIDNNWLEIKNTSLEYNHIE